MAFFEWMAGLFVLFTFSVIFISMSGPIYQMINIAAPFVANDSNATRTLNIINMAWTEWPIVILAGAAIFFLAAAQKRESDTGYV